MSARCWLLLLALVGGTGAYRPAVGAAQPNMHEITRQPSVAEFVARAREGTARYRDQQAAIDAGFTRVGVDFPAMGEHWVSLARVTSGTFDAASPSVLTYTHIGGVPTLVGVAYTALLQPGESVPDYAPARSYWHEHNGTVVEESFPLTEPPSPPDPGAAHLAILHAWVWTDNSDGLFTTDNWSLPYLRAGLPGPAISRPELAGALSLGTGGVEYYLLAARNAGRLTDEEARRVERTLRAGAAELASQVERPRSGAGLDPAVERVLMERWRALWESVAASVAPDHAAAIGALARAGGGSHAGSHGVGHSSQE